LTLFSVTALPEQNRTEQGHPFLTPFRSVLGPGEKKGKEFLAFNILTSRRIFQVGWLMMNRLQNAAGGQSRPKIN